MSFGLRVWDGSGRVTLDTKDGITRVLGSLVASSNGSLQDARLQGVRSWVISPSTSTYGFRAYISGTTVAWEMLRPQYPGMAQPTLIIYGVY